MIKLTKREIATLQALADKFDAAKAELADAFQELIDEWQGEFDERSERWQETEAGTAAQERISQVQEWADNLESVETSFAFDELA